jgi:Bax protein
MVLDRREGLLRLQESLKSGDGIAIDDLEKVRSGAVLLRVLDEKAAATLVPTDENFASVIDELLYKVDIIPTGLALGQAAYESGYGASRFAVEGNALFGQWTYGGKGLVPEQQRKSLGDHRIAAFDWPFDSVRGYYINLMSHPAYEDFRRLRAETRAAGRPLKSMELADGLIKYSERGQEYVDTLKGIMRANGLDSADNAVFRDEPMRFSIGADGETAAEALRRDFEAMRASGEMAEIVARMRLE